jgi:hypothetical protein
LNIIGVGPVGEPDAGPAASSVNEDVTAVPIVAPDGNEYKLIIIEQVSVCGDGMA